MIYHIRFFREELEGPRYFGSLVIKNTDYDAVQLFAARAAAGNGFTSFRIIPLEPEYVKRHGFPFPNTARLCTARVLMNGFLPDKGASPEIQAAFAGWKEGDSLNDTQLPYFAAAVKNYLLEAGNAEARINLLKSPHSAITVSKAVTLTDWLEAAEEYLNNL